VCLFPALLEFQHSTSVKRKATFLNQCSTFPHLNWRSDRRCAVGANCKQFHRWSFSHYPYHLQWNTYLSQWWTPYKSGRERWPWGTHMHKRALKTRPFNDNTQRTSDFTLCSGRRTTLIINRENSLLPYDCSECGRHAVPVEHVIMPMFPGWALWNYRTFKYFASYGLTAFLSGHVISISFVCISLQL